MTTGKAFLECVARSSLIGATAATASHCVAAGSPDPVFADRLPNASVERQARQVEVLGEEPVGGGVERGRERRPGHAAAEGLQ